MRKLLVTSAVALLVGACGLPFGIGHPSTADLTHGAADNLAKAKSFEVKARFTQNGKPTDLDIQFTAPATIHITGSQGADEFEMLRYGGKVYYKGASYLATIITDQDAASVLKGARTRWVTSSQFNGIDTSALTDPSKARQVLTSIVTKRQDDVTVDGQNTAELTLPVAVVNITEDSPYRLVRVRSIPGQPLQEGVADLDESLSNYDKNFGSQAPDDVFDFDDPTTWPPRYVADTISQTTISGTNSCDDPCRLSAEVENSGGLKGGTMGSTVTFKLTSAADNSLLGSCSVTIQPDHPHAEKFTVGCSIQSSAWTNFTGSYHYGADIDNPTYD